MHVSTICTCMHTSSHVQHKLLPHLFLRGSRFSQRYSGPLPRSQPATMAPRCSEVNVHPTTMSSLGRHESRDIGYYGAPAHLSAVFRSANTTTHSSSLHPAAVEPPTVGHPTGTTCSFANLHSTARGRFVKTAAHAVAMHRKVTHGRSRLSCSTIGAASQAPMWVRLSLPSLYLSLNFFVLLPSSSFHPFSSPFGS